MKYYVEISSSSPEKACRNGFLTLRKKFQDISWLGLFKTWAREGCLPRLPHSSARETSWDPISPPLRKNNLETFSPSRYFSLTYYLRLLFFYLVYSCLLSLFLWLSFLPFEFLLFFYLLFLWILFLWLRLFLFFSVFNDIISVVSVSFIL